MIPIYIFPTLTTYEEWDHLPRANTIEDGSYVYIREIKVWYLKKFDNYFCTVLSDIPKELRTILMLLGE